MMGTFSILEFDKIKEEIKPFLLTGGGMNKFDELLNFLPLEEAVNELDKVDEAMVLANRYGLYPLKQLPDIAPYLVLADKGGCLNAEYLFDVASLVTSLGEARDYLKGKNCEKLFSIVSSLSDLSDLEKSILKIISPDLSIYDNASDALRNIRRDIKRCEKEMEGRLSSLIKEHSQYLTTQTLSIKNGHFALPVSISFKNKVKGVIQDVSNSGMTVFIEPESIISLNNKIIGLRSDEKEEIFRLLLALSGLVASNKDELGKYNEAISQLDLISAKARYGLKHDCHIVSLGEDNEISLLGARHPLLGGGKIIPNDFILSKEGRIIVISGPNAGGKTVAIKTLGIISIMSQCGIPSPCLEGSSLPYFPKILADIGDRQSISDNLSTFSGHIRSVSSILEKCGPRDLVLLDEVGTGTSPKEGEAIAIAVTKTLMDKGCYALISSHFEGLKAFALEEDRIRNASMLFDEKDLKPTYVLKMGLPGESYGLEVAKRFGLDEKTMGYALDYASHDISPSLSKSIKRLNQEIKEADQAKIEAMRKNKEAEEAKIRLEKYEYRLKKREEKIDSFYKEEKEKALEEYKEELGQMLLSLKNGRHSMGDVRKAMRKFDEEEKEETFNEELKEGDYISIPSMGICGRLVSLKGDKATIISEEGMTINTSKSKIKKTPEPKKKEYAPTRQNIDIMGENLPLELNIIGMREEEGRRSLVSYLDKCRIKGYKRVRIIHGFGSGILRKMTRDYLSSHQEFIEKFETAGEGEGSGGATIAYLK